jgi:hypothetical protein
MAAGELAMIPGAVALVASTAQKTNRRNRLPCVSYNT